jgi:hypothetical protein
VPLVDRGATSVLNGCARIYRAVRLDDPWVFAQCAAALGLGGVAVIVWWFSPLLVDCFTSLSDAPAATIQRLGSNAWIFYRRAVEVVILGCLAALWSLRKRARSGQHVPVTTAAPVLLVTVIAAILLVFPFRLVWNISSRPVLWGSERCYLLGEHQNDGLVFCPMRDAGRTQQIALRDPELKYLQETAARIFDVPRTAR